MSLSSVVLFNTTMTITITNSSSIIISILIGIFLSLIALVTALGNIVVLLAFYCDKKLRTINGKHMEYIFSAFVYLFFLYKRLFYIKYGHC